jgi:LDH2 family malate/lactate/ureidoglycolate dehydrogenase
MALAVRLTAAQHREFSAAVLDACSCDRSEASVVSDVLLWCDQRSLAGQGLARLPVLVKRLKRGLIRSPVAPCFESLAPSLAQLDAGHGFGELAGRRGMGRAIELAQSQGIGMVGVARSNHFGAASYYCQQAVESGCLGLAFSNAFPKVAPYGGTRAALGTNPLAFGCPTRRGPMLVDFATAASSGSGLRAAAVEGRRLPVGWALDAHGVPTDDPEAAADGCLLPAAGPKGFGLALMVEVLSAVLTGAAFGRDVGSLFNTWDRPVNVGQSFIAVSIDRFMDGPAFLERIEQLLSWVKSSPPAAGSGAVRYPGELRSWLADASERNGIPMPGDLVGTLGDLAQGLGVATPW